MTIELLFFEDCPHHEPARERVIKTALELGIDVEIRDVPVETREQAVQNRFLGSPTVRINGADIDPQSHDRLDFGMTCRRYDGDGLPPRSMIAAAMREAIGEGE